MYFESVSVGFLSGVQPLSSLSSLAPVAGTVLTMWVTTGWPSTPGCDSNDRPRLVSVSRTRSHAEYTVHGNVKICVLQSLADTVITVRSRNDSSCGLAKWVM